MAGQVQILRTVGGLNGPGTVAVHSEGNVLVSEQGGQRVTVIDALGSRRNFFGGQRFQQPVGVTIAGEDKVIVSDMATHHILEFDMNGRYLATHGSPGNEQLQFQHPVGIATMNRKILVADSGNGRIQVMNSDLTYSHSYGGYRGIPVQLMQPYCIATDSSGMIYVTEHGNNQVKKIDPECNTVVAEFGRDGEGALSLPYGIAIDTTNNKVYVSSSNDRVAVFATDGSFLYQFGIPGNGEGQLSSPHGLAFDERTRDLYVCDYSNNRLVVYRLGY